MRIDVVAYDHPDAAGLIAEVQQEYEARYGSQDLLRQPNDKAGHDQRVR